MVLYAANLDITMFVRVMASCHFYSLFIRTPEGLYGPRDVRKEQLVYFTEIGKRAQGRDCCLRETYGDFVYLHCDRCTSI